MSVPERADREKVKAELVACGRKVQDCWFIDTRLSILAGEGAIARAAYESGGLQQ